MKDLKSELLDLIALYRILEEEVSRIVQIDDSKDPQATVRAIVQNASCFARIAEMSARVERVSDGWKECRLHLDEKARAETQQLADATRDQALRLRELVSLQAEKIRLAHNRLGKSLTEIGKGAQYLKVLKPPKNNYPKFIDSMQ